MKAYKTIEVIENNSINVTKVLYTSDDCMFVIIDKNNERNIALSESEFTKLLFTSMNMHEILSAPIATDEDVNGLTENRR